MGDKSDKSSEIGPLPLRVNSLLVRVLAAEVFKSSLSLFRGRASRCSIMSEILSKRYLGGVSLFSCTSSRVLISRSHMVTVSINPPARILGRGSLIRLLRLQGYSVTTLQRSCATSHRNSVLSPVTTRKFRRCPHSLTLLPCYAIIWK